MRLALVLRLSLMALLLALSSNASALNLAWDDVRVHGFFSQAAIISHEVNLIGDSTDGAYDFAELGLNASLRLTPNVLVAAQVVSISTSLDGSEKPEVDYMLLDWTIGHGESSSWGTRLGRVRLSNGLHYNTRDVASERPGILMPQSVYIDNLGARAFLFAATGGQLYLNTFTESADWSLVFTALAEQSVSERVELAVFRRPLPGEYQYSNGYFAGVRRDDADGDWTHSLTWGQIAADYNPAATDAVLNSALDYQEFVYSLQYHHERYEITAEFNRRQIELGVTTGAGTRADAYISIGGYIEARFFVGQNFEWFVRYDELNQNIGDRGGHGRSLATGLPRYYSFARDSGIGLSWEFAPQTHLLTEFHYIDGLETADAGDNPSYLSGQLSRYWNYFSVMLAYRF